MNGVMISWTRENGRTRDLARELGFDAHFIYLPSRFGLLGRYLRQLHHTRRLLARLRPNRVALMLPPAPLLFALPRRGSRWSPRLIFDLHTGFFFDPKWQWACRFSLNRMRKLGGVAIVTNSHLQQICKRARVRSIVLHDILSIEDRQGAEPREPYVLCPLSYANDEPVQAILEAARLTPEVAWLLTGRAPEEVRASAPGNVKFTGFVSENDYAMLVRGGLGVVALTTRDHTMQRAGYEAFSAGVPHVTSDFKVLRNFYERSAEYTAPEASHISAAVRRLAASQDSFTPLLNEVRARRTNEQTVALAHLAEAIGLARSSSDTYEEARS